MATSGGSEPLRRRSSRALARRRHRSLGATRAGDASSTAGSAPAPGRRTVAVARRAAPTTRSIAAARRCAGCLRAPMTLATPTAARRLAAPARGAAASASRCQPRDRRLRRRERRGARACSASRAAPRAPRCRCCSPARPAPARTSPRGSSTPGRRRNGALRADQLRRHPQRADGGRAVRLRARRVLRRGARTTTASSSAAAGGTVFLDEIDDTPQDAADQAAARARGPRRHAGSARTSGAGRLPHRRRDQPRPAPSSIAARRRSAPTSTSAWRSCSIELPPLRERLEDLPALVEHFIARFYREEPAARAARSRACIAPRRSPRSPRYPWPGNVRELRNVVFHALVAKRAGTSCSLSDLPRRLLGARDGEGHGVVDLSALERALASRTFDSRAEKEWLERLALEQALTLARGNAARAAELLGAVGRGEASDPGGTVRAMMRRLGVRAARRPRRRSPRTR